MAVADLAVRCDNSGNTGVVMGATAAAEAAAVRKRFPTLPFLLPGIGRQGGDVEAAVRASYTGDPASCLIAVAGAVIMPRILETPRWLGATASVGRCRPTRRCTRPAILICGISSRAFPTQTH